MKSYLDLLELVKKNGTIESNRTIYKTISYFGTQSRYFVSKDKFPLITTKKTNFNAVVHELLWFISGDTNIKYLVDNNVNIWNEWPYEIYKKHPDYKNETLIEFKEKIINDLSFSKLHGNLGPVYGKQWNNFGNINQLQNAINSLKENKRSRRIIVSSWNPMEIDEMLLPPCHCFFQFYCNDNNELSLQLYQRSADLFLGVPFNIASYSLLLLLVAQVTNLKPKEFIHTIGDCHIYDNHLEVVDLQLDREPKTLPKIILNPNIKDLWDFKFNDIELIDYDHWPILKGKVAV